MWEPGEIQTPPITSISGAGGNLVPTWQGRQPSLPAAHRVVKRLESVALPRKRRDAYNTSYRVLGNHQQEKEERGGTPIITISPGPRRSADLVLCGGKSQAPACPGAVRSTNGAVCDGMPPVALISDGDMDP